MISIEQMGKNARIASHYLAKMGSAQKNDILKSVAEALKKHKALIQSANEADVMEATKNGMHKGMIDRLILTDDRIEAMATGLLQLAALEDPIGQISDMKTRPNGLMIGTKRVPLGVIAMIYESRPNVTVDAFGLTFKSGNAVILRGGSDCIQSNIAITEVIVQCLKECQVNPDVIQLVTDTDRRYVMELMKMNEYIDVIIPRGGKGLIQNVVKNSTVPVIETGTGNCHIFVDADADIKMACDIIYNAKTQRIGVCNACESLVIHKDIADTAIPAIVNRLTEQSVEIRGDETAIAIDQRIIPATEQDWGMEYLDYIISLKVVNSIDEAIEHINKYNTGHSEAIITKDYANAQKFLNEIDAAAVYVNASTRFTDGFEFGFGAEIGISTQKIHARGPMGLMALTTSKYIIYGNGQIR